jgi:RP/EB family microtubule-associated protein
LEEIDQLKAKNAETDQLYSELRTEMEGLEKERDFYYEKLRDIEVLLQEVEDRGEGTPLSASLFKILYATKEGFEAGEGEVEEEVIEQVIHNNLIESETY